MSTPSWYPDTSRDRLNFFLKTFPAFIVLMFFLYFVLDWLGAFEFLEILVRDNSVWLLDSVFGMDTSEFSIGMFQRIDPDPLTNSNVYFGEPYFPGLRMPTYPRTLLIIRACTGMEAGALLMTLIFITPAKWQNKTVAHVTNLLMMHIGNTFRVAFHFWFTEYLYLRWGDADKAFFYAHDLLSKVFGFVGIVIFTLVIERTGVRIVSTFGAWIDAMVDGLKRITWRIQGKAYYLDKVVTYEESKTKDKVPTRVEEITKKNFYPTEEIEKNDWSFFKRTFGMFAGVSAVIIGIGIIPSLNYLIGSTSDNIAVAFGASQTGGGIFNTFWYKSTFQLLNADNAFITNVVSSGVFLFAIMIGVLAVTPSKKVNKGVAMGLTPIIIFPLNFLRLGVQKWATWSLAVGDIKDSRPLLYENLADIVTTWFPFFFWILLFAGLMLIYRALKVRAFSMMWAWMNQLVVTLGWVVGLRDKPGIEPKIIAATTSIGSE
jgi:exosortase/archaeosortase family protein